MDFLEMLSEQQEEKEVIDRVSMLYLSEEDIDVCNYVSKQLCNMDVLDIYYGNEISFFDLISSSLDEISVFGNGLVSERIFKILKTTDFYNGVNIDNHFGTGVYYDINMDGKVDRNSGKITRFSLPSKLNELSVYHFGHELVHSLKETNYDEYIYAKSLGEVIPLFFEFIIYNPQEILKKELIKFRMNSLINNKLEYDHFNSLYCRVWMDALCFNDMEMYKKANLLEYIRSKIGCYLNSFYYALILFYMYKENSDKILSLVCDVLNKKITTLDMLNKLNIYGDIKGDVFENELGKIRKLVNR